MSFQICSRSLFLTYPECPLTKEIALELLTELLGNLKEYLIASELHANGNQHLHCYIQLEETFRTRNARFADMIYQGQVYHGNYQGCRGEKNVAKYCAKEDDYISNFDLNERLKRKQNHKKLLGAALISKKISLVECIQENPEMIFGYKKLKQDLQEYFADELDKRGELPLFLPNPWGKILSTNISGKRRHFWIFSRKPNVGKTFLFAKPLEKSYRCYIQCGNYQYWGINGQEQLVILDEYNTAGLRYSEINSMADGTYCYRICNIGIKKLADPLIIILSNQSIVDLYPNMFDLLYARFNEIELF